MCSDTQARFDRRKYKQTLWCVDRSKFNSTHPAIIVYTLLAIYAPGGCVQRLYFRGAHIEPAPFFQAFGIFGQSQGCRGRRFVFSFRGLPRGDFHHPFQMGR